MPEVKATNKRIEKFIEQIYSKRSQVDGIEYVSD